MLSITFQDSLPIQIHANVVITQDGAVIAYLIDAMGNRYKGRTCEPDTGYSHRFAFDLPLAYAEGQWSLLICAASTGAPLQNLPIIIKREQLDPDTDYLHPDHYDPED